MSPAALQANHQPGRRLANRFAAVVRWLHIYVSLLGFSMLIFFAVTGITLNHPTWFGADVQQASEHQGQVPREWLNKTAAAADAPRSDSGEVDHSRAVAKLEVAEFLRERHHLRGTVQEFRVDEQECMVVFKGPGYAADAFINRQTGNYSLTVSAMGFAAIMNDLHKGRDAGSGWSLILDVSALLTVFVSITGMILIFYLKRKRWSGILTAVAGTLLLIGGYFYLVP